MKKFVLILFLMMNFVVSASKVKVIFDNTVYYGTFSKNANYSNKIELSVGDVFAGTNLIVYSNQAINDIYMGGVFNFDELKLFNIIGYDKGLYYKLNAKFKNLEIMSKKYFKGAYFGEFKIAHKWDNIYGGVGVYVIKNKKLFIYPKASIGIVKNMRIDDNLSFDVYAELMARGDKFRVMCGLKMIIVE